MAVHDTCLDYPTFFVIVESPEVAVAIAIDFGHWITDPMWACQSHRFIGCIERIANHRNQWTGNGGTKPE